MSSRFDILTTPIQGLSVLVRQPTGDSRGYLERLFCLDELSHLLGDRQVVQMNHTLTLTKGTVRGLHFQYPPHAEMKFVTCQRGSIFDVAVDLRKDSPTFLQWHGELLSADNFKTFVIPEGFAHGFQTLTDDVEMLYIHTMPYTPASEAGLHPQDPRLRIAWPLPIAEMSPRDSNQPMIANDFQGILK